MESNKSQAHEPHLTQPLPAYEVPTLTALGSFTTLTGSSAICNPLEEACGGDF